MSDRAAIAQKKTRHNRAGFSVPVWKSAYAVCSAATRLVKRLNFREAVFL